MVCWGRFELMEFEIRRAVVNDAEAIALVHVKGWQSTYVGIVPDAYLRALDVERRARLWKEDLAAGSMSIFVAEDAAGVFAFANGGKLREAIGDYQGELYAIYLLADRRRQGVGGRLVRKVAAALHADGLSGMAVWVLEENRSAVQFYRGLGAVPIAQKSIEIGGATLADLAFGWPTLQSLLP
jgi:GNAT superfamily N-acetyltransferase